jgi:tRNA nucleotidyltransferase (CCA-adding enzyme)
MIHMFWNHFPILRVGALDIDTGSVPQLRALAGVPQPPKHHPEVDVWVHVLMAVHQARLLTEEPAVHFAVLLHDIGKGTTRADVLPQHIDHEERGVPLVRHVCEKLGAPMAWVVAGIATFRPVILRTCEPIPATTMAWRNLAAIVCEHHTRCHRATEMGLAGKRRLLRRVGAIEEPDLFELFLLACEADARGRLGLERREYPSAEIMRAAMRS